MENSQQNRMRNVPNILTMLRFVMIPVMLVIALLNIAELRDHFSNEIPMTWGQLGAMIVFVIASLTDFLDGYLARKYQVVSNFGKLMDPIADKVLVFAALIVFVYQNIVFSWVVIIMILREFLVTGVRLVAAGDNIVIAASPLGKIKTVLQMIAVILIFIFGFKTSEMAMWYKIGHIAAQVVLYASLVMTVISGFDYVYKNRKVFESNKGE